MFIVRHKNLFFILSAVLIVASIAMAFVYGIHFNTDFRGGSILEVSYQGERPSIDEIRIEIEKLNLGGFSLRPSGEKNFVLRAREINPEEKNSLLMVFSKNGTIVAGEERFNSVGPIVGESLKKKSYVAVGVVILAIVLFITFAFRKVSEPVSSWKYGLATIVALAHDVIIPGGAYIFYGHFTGAEIDLLFITAILAILGYSVHDSIVVFDRVRENLRINKEYGKKEAFPELVGRSLKQTFGRSINTSLTIFIVLLVLFVVGSAATKHFAFTLLVGVVAGTYSSIFVGAPLLVVFERIQRKK